MGAYRQVRSPRSEPFDRLKRPDSTEGAWGEGQSLGHLTGGRGGKLHF